MMIQHHVVPRIRQEVVQGRRHADLLMTALRPFSFWLHSCRCDGAYANAGSNGGARPVPQFYGAGDHRILSWLLSCSAWGVSTSVGSRSCFGCPASRAPVRRGRKDKASTDEQSVGWQRIRSARSPVRTWGWEHRRGLQPLLAVARYQPRTRLLICRLPRPSRSSGLSIWWPVSLQHLHRDLEEAQQTILHQGSSYEIVAAAPPDALLLVPFDALRACGTLANVPPILPGSSVVDMFKYKMGHNLTCMGNITEMFAPIMGFWGLDYWTTSHKFYHDRPLLPWQPNLRQKRL